MAGNGHPYRDGPSGKSKGAAVSNSLARIDPRRAARENAGTMAGGFRRSGRSLTFAGRGRLGPDWGWK